MSAKSFLNRVNRYTKRVLSSVFLCNIIAIMLVLGCSNTPKKSIGVWKTVLEGDWNARLNDVHFVTETHGWAVGNAIGQVPNHSHQEASNSNHSYNDGAESIIIHTNDGGKNWKRQHSGIFGHPLNKVFFLSKNKGWCVGEAGVIITTMDGGRNWKQIETSTKHNLHSIYLKNNTGWIVGDWGTILKSVDGGKTYKQVDGSSIRRKSLKGIYFFDNLNGWIITYSTPNQNEQPGNIYFTDDGGTTWHKQFSTDSALFGLYFIDRMNGWVIGDKRSLYTTIDGGETWEFVTDGSNIRHKEEYGQPEYFGNEPLHTFTLYDIDVVDNQYGWIVGDLGVVLHTKSVLMKNEKNVWKHQRGGPRFHNSSDGVLLGVDFVSKKLGWTVGENGTILHTRNGGITWEAQSSPTHLLFDVCITSKNSGFVVGDRGTILQTDDGGSKWNAQDSRTAECFGATHFVTKQKGWAVAEAGVILHTTNGGEVWLPQTSNTKQDLLTVFFVDAETGWCAGSAGEIVHTSDGGKTWSKQKSGTLFNLFDIHFTSKNDGWVVGLFGTLIFTIDGGKKWQLSTLTHHLSKTDRNKNIWLNAVYFVNKDVGWVVGEDGFVFHTKNSGKTWSRKFSNTQDFLYDVFFISNEEGWIVGKNGIVLHTMDGGENWRPQRTDTRTDLTSIQMSSSRSGLVTGQGGTILKYEVIETE